jgi:DNA helicase-2/ATP-dependent DNA helicase PcrA
LLVESFEKAYASLNAAQKKAVDTIDGPVLVIAGPGTGKTQLISTRIGHILKVTDTLPQNILCLTFTEAGVAAMRERLIKMLDKAAYEIQINTYHAFGSDIVRRYSINYEESDLEPIDEVGSILLLQEIIHKLPYGNPLKFMSQHTGDISSFISDSKRALLMPEDILAAADNNIEFIEEINKQAAECLAKLTMVNKKSVPVFEELLEILRSYEVENGLKPALPLHGYAVKALEQALESFAADGKTTPITKWKNAWLAKDAAGSFIVSGLLANKKVKAAAEVYRKYQDELAARHSYDYDDMILRAISYLETSPEFKYSLAEQYQYIMLDEFQDTNPAQMKLIELITDHPVNEGRPNILAVGDDDQAIYAFQGADHANMMQFARHFRDVKPISLEENYRSHAHVLQTAQAISDQITERLHHQFKDIEKNLNAANTKLPKQASISARRFKSDAAQYAWVAGEVKRLVTEEDIEPSQIAVLAPKHKYLMAFLPHLSRRELPIKYERRENILDSPIVRQLEQMCRLVLALAANDQETCDALWPEILSYDFWRLPTEKIWQACWQASEDRRPWTISLLDNPTTKQIVLFFLRLKDLLPVTTLEQQLDILIGVEETGEYLKLESHSPLFEFYFGKERQSSSAAEFMQLLSHLSLLRHRLRDWRRNEEDPLGLQDFIDFIHAYRSAGVNILDSSPYREAEDSVNLMTVYGAKGREFKAVFVLSCQDDVWGSASRSQGNRLSLPANLEYMRYRGVSEDERLRLLYVAITRAKTHLYLTGYEKALTGRSSALLKYLEVSEDEDGIMKSRILPEPYNQILSDKDEVPNLEILEDYWVNRHRPPFAPNLKALLSSRLENYQLSPTHLNTFTDVTIDGPEAFLLDSILRFPKATTPAANYGIAIHSTVRRYLQDKQRGADVSRENMVAYFEKQLSGRKLPGEEFELLLDRGRVALTAWLNQTLHEVSAEDRFEHNFKNESGFVGDAHMTGKKNKTATVVDFKTGQSYAKWASNIKLHKYRQQLLIYKILVESSARFAGYKVEKGILEFVEPNEEGLIIELELNFDNKEVEEIKSLIKAVWQRIKALDLPDVSKYSPTIVGVREFEKDLIAGL